MKPLDVWKLAGFRPHAQWSCLVTISPCTLLSQMDWLAAELRDARGQNHFFLTRVPSA